MIEPVKPDKAAAGENAVFWWCMALAVVICISGCGDFFASKPTELESRAILSELSQARESPHIGNPLPEMYRGPSKRVKVKDGVKLFYFTRHHTVDKLAGLVTEQLAKKISQSGPTNQLIVHCTDDADADKVLEFLDMVDVPPIQVNIDCLILERFGDETMDWETSIYIENMLGERITFGGKTSDRLPLGTVTTIGDVTRANYLLPTFPGASLRESKRADFGLDIGYWAKQGILGHQIRAMVDMLISRGYLKILLNPTLETVNGKEATVTIRDNAPIEKIVTKDTLQPYSITEYQWVEDTLKVTPSVFADGSIGLKTDIKIGSKSKPEGVVQASIITERSIKVDENRIKPGESLVIGGMRKSEKRSVVRGVPFFKDIPVLGVLFSSKDFEEKATEIIFILTPSISSGSVEHAKVVEDIRKKYAPLKYETGLKQVLSDPLGTDIYTDVIERKAVEAETARIRAEIEASAMSKDVEKMKDALSAAHRQLDAEKARVEKAQAEKDKAIAEAGIAAAQAQTARLVADKAKAEVKAAKVAADEAEKKAQALADQAKVEKIKAQKSADQAAKIKTQVEKD
jgi:hypothetical protein